MAARIPWRGVPPLAMTSEIERGIAMRLTVRPAWRLVQSDFLSIVQRYTKQKTMLLVYPSPIRNARACRREREKIEEMRPSLALLFFTYSIDL